MRRLCALRAYISREARGVRDECGLRWLRPDSKGSGIASCSTGVPVRSSLRGTGQRLARRMSPNGPNRKTPPHAPEFGPMNPLGTRYVCKATEWSGLPRSALGDASHAASCGANSAASREPRTGSTLRRQRLATPCRPGHRGRGRLPAPLPPAAAMAGDECAGACCSAACLSGAKAGLAALLTLEALVCAAFGAWIGRRGKAMRLANSFAAGVFLSAAIVHILPHAAKWFSGAHADPAAHAGLEADGSGLEHAAHAAHKEFPVANVVVLAVLLAFVFIETVLLPGVSHGSQSDSTSCHSYGPADTECMRALQCGVAHGDARNGIAAADLPKYGSIEPASASGSADSLPTMAYETEAEFDGAAVADSDEANGEDDEVGRFLSPAFASSTALMLAVSVHSFLESLAFGLTPSLPSAVTVFIAIAAHRWIVSTAVLARLMSAPGLRRTQHVVLYGGFVMVLPIGVALGIALARLPATVEGFFVAAAGGAFLYLGMEGLFAQLAHNTRWRMLKFFWTLLGASTMVTVDFVLFKLNGGH